MRTHRCTTTAGVALLLALLMMFPGCGDDDGGGSGPSNRPPSVSISIQSNLKAVVAGDAVVLEANATDPDFDPLTYAWEVNPPTAGTIVDPTLDTVTWQPGPALGEVTITCTVSDGMASASASTAGGQLVIGTGVPAGTLSQETTWARSGSPYVVLGDLTVSATARLTIEPGVSVLLRPRLVGLTWISPRVEIRGVLDARGTGSTQEESIRFEGGRTNHPQSTQHQGIRILGDGSALLEHLTVRDGEDGMRNSSSQSLELRRCTFAGNSNGFSADNGSQTKLVDCQVRDNVASGIFVSGANVTLSSDNGVQSASQVVSNVGAGVTVGASTGATASLHAELTLFSGNGQGHLVVNNNGGTASVRVSCSDLTTVPASTPKIAIKDQFCVVLTLALEGNYWGGQFSEPAPIIAFFEDGRYCDAGVDVWKLSEGDWLQQPFRLEPCASTP